MSGLQAVGKGVGVVLHAGHTVLNGAEQLGRFAAGRVRTARERGGAGDIGMIRLLDLHAASCAGDALVAIGMAGTIFFAGASSEARAKVALYLLVTMAPFALLAPVVGPMLDRFRHGRRYALAVTMLGRAFLAWVISDQIHTWALYPAAFAILVLSRAYGVARSAAVPRLLPPGLGLVEAGARASLFGTVAGAVLGAVGVGAAWFGPQWPLRIATVVFVAGMIVSLRLPGKADSEPPETPPRLFQVFSRNSIKVLTGKLTWTTLAGGTVLRGVYGYLTLFLAFRARDGDFALTVIGWRVPQTAVLGLAVGGLGVGSFLATAVCTRLRIRRPLALQAAGLALASAAALAATLWYGLPLVALLCVLVAFASGVAKLSVDAVIQERVDEKLRASAFSHSETLLMLAFVLGGVLGLIPLAGPVGMAVLTAGVVAATARIAWWAASLRNDRLRGAIRPSEETTVRLAPQSPASPPSASPPSASPPSASPASASPASASPASAPPTTAAGPTRDVDVETEPTTRLAPPGYHLYRPGRKGDAPG